MSVSTRLLHRDEYNLAADFINEHWQANHIYCREKSLFDWTFFENPAWLDSDHYSFAIAEDNGRVVGMLGVIPFTLSHYGNNNVACWLVNWKVCENSRSNGAGLALLKIFRDMGFHTVSFGINDVIARLYRGLRWEIAENIPRLLWVPHSSTHRLHHLCMLCEANILYEDILSLVQPGEVRIASKEPTPFTKDFENEWNRAGWLPQMTTMIGCRRDFSYLNWRYLSHPLFKYNTAVLAEGDSLGLAVWRNEDIYHLGPDGMEVIDSMIRLVEFLPTSPLNAQSLITKVQHDAIDSGALGIDFYSYHQAINTNLYNSGFVNLLEVDFANRLPSRFSPIDNLGGSIKSAVKVGFPGPTSTMNCDWYWTRSDSDQDRPN